MNQLLSFALGQYGVAEIPGPKNNPAILDYASEIGYAGIKDDETAWCSIFMNWCAMKAGLERSGKLNARSWMDVGTAVTEPETGDIVVFWRGSKNGNLGHVGIYINYSVDKKYVHCLGGNQSNKVNISAFDVSMILGFRRLSVKA